MTDSRLSCGQVPAEDIQMVQPIPSNARLDREGISYRYWAHYPDCLAWRFPLHPILNPNLIRGIVHTSRGRGPGAVVSKYQYNEGQMLGGAGRMEGRSPELGSCAASRRRSCRGQRSG